MTDGDLVRQARAGNADAYGQLACRWAGRVLAVCHGRVGRTAAEDLAQESLLRGLRGLDSLADPDRFGGWIVGIARCVCLDWLKSAKRSEVSLDALVDRQQTSVDLMIANPQSPPGESDQAERTERLLAEIDRLPDVYRETLTLYYHQECTYEELASQLGVSAATVNARLTKARQMLRERLAAWSEKE